MQDALKGERHQRKPLPSRVNSLLYNRINAVLGCPGHSAPVMGLTYSFPYSGPKRLAGRWNRIVERWQRGGVEDYSLAKHAAGRELARVWRPDQGIEVSEHRVRLDGLPEAFRGFRVVHLTDIHHGLFLPLQAVVDAVELANRLAPDLVALTGDFVTFSTAYIEPVSAVLGRLRARCGVFAVLGNHDFRVGANQVARTLAGQGIEVLRNRNSIVRRHGHGFYVAGIDDLRYRADLPRALHGIPRGAATLLLSHNPAIIHRASRSGVSLILSGHTHGGQVNLPLVGSIYGRSPRRLRFKVGWDALGATQIYVSRGIGTVVVPVRYRCPAEIPHLHLQPREAGPKLVTRPRH